MVGITIYHASVQGRTSFEVWKMVALPCSIPLVNAYLFNVLQSLFLIFMVTDFPRRDALGEANESIFARPLGNRVYWVGKVLGLFFLFASVNVGVILGALFVNIGSMAPLRVDYYFFYFLTLNVPVFFFVSGLSLWLVRWLRVRYIVLLILLGGCWFSLFYLPYHYRGTWDFLAVGVPNLFSDITGHVGLWSYLLHRLAYLAVGWGLLLCSVKRLKRLPNAKQELSCSVFCGMFLLLVGGGCFFAREWEARVARTLRQDYCASFVRHPMMPWCRVLEHDIRLRQDGEELAMKSDMLLKNMDVQDVDTLVLYLNPGLKIKDMQVAGKPVTALRDHQVVLIPYALASGDSVRVQLAYGGEIDARFVDLHLSAEEYEDSFRGDNFFPTGRQGAFVRDDFLLLTPACAWYPVTFPPVNPTCALFTRETFTRYRLTVEQPRQKIVLSQGACYRTKDGIKFEPSRSLTGISLCGGDFVSRKFETGDLRVSLSSYGNHAAAILDYYPIKQKSFKTFLREDLYPDFVEDFSSLYWYDKQVKALYLVETPLSFYTSYNPAKSVGGQVEPGVVFLSERGFDMYMMFFWRRLFAEEKPVMGFVPDKAQGLCQALGHVLGMFNCKFRDIELSHPLQISAKRVQTPNNYNVFSLFEKTGLLVQSSRYPFLSYFLQTFKDERSFLIDDGSVLYRYTPEEEVKDFVYGRDLYELLLASQTDSPLLANVVRWKVKDWLNRIAGQVYVERFYAALDSVYRESEREISADTFFSDLNRRLGTVVNPPEVFRDWLTTDHRQYFQLDDWRCLVFMDEKAGERWFKIVGKILNKGESASVISFDVDNVDMRDGSDEWNSFVTYVKPGEAKEFEYVFKVPERNLVRSELNMGLAANRPSVLKMFKRAVDDSLWQAMPPTWRTIDTTNFGRTPGVWVVDDMDEGFTLKDGKRRSWLQRWQKRDLNLEIRHTQEDYWTFNVGQYQGDSIRGAYFKGVGDSTSTATWTVSLPEPGMYEIKAAVSDWARQYTLPSNLIYHYTVAYGRQVETVDVRVDDQVRENFGWISLGIFKLPAGEVSVTLSDRAEEGRGIFIMADAMRWEKQPE